MMGVPGLQKGIQGFSLLLDAIQVRSRFTLLSGHSLIPYKKTSRNDPELNSLALLIQDLHAVLQKASNTGKLSEVMIDRLNRLSE